MRLLIRTVLIGGLLGTTLPLRAQGPGGAAGLSKSADVDDLVSRMMAFDKDKDGTLTRAEIVDERLLRLFNRADADKDGKVTKAELTALAEKEHVEDRGGPGGPPGGGPGGSGGGRLGEVLRAMMRQALGLSSQQQAEVEALQKDVDAKLAKILNEEQKAKFKQMRERGPGRFGPPGGGGRPSGGPLPGGGRPNRGDE